MHVLAVIALILAAYSLPMLLFLAWLISRCHPKWRAWWDQPYQARHTTPKPVPEANADTAPADPLHTRKPK